MWREDDAMHSASLAGLDGAYAGERGLGEGAEEVVTSLTFDLIRHFE